MRGLVPPSSNCLTWAFTLPILMSPLDFSAMFWREREELCHIEGQCHMKEQYHITAVNLERLRFKICFTWSQISSAGLVMVCVCQTSSGFGSVGHDSHLEGAQHPECGMGEEGRSMVLGQGPWWCWASQHLPAWQLAPVTRNTNFGVVVSFPRKIIFAALTAPPDRGESVCNHRFLLGLREKCQIAEHCGNSFNGYLNDMEVMSPLVWGLVRVQCTLQSHSRNGPTDLFTVLAKPCSSTANSKKTSVPS